MNDTANTATIIPFDPRRSRPRMYIAIRCHFLTALPDPMPQPANADEAPGEDAS